MIVERTRMVLLVAVFAGVVTPVHAWFGWSSGPTRSPEVTRAIKQAEDALGAVESLSPDDPPRMVQTDCRGPINDLKTTVESTPTVNLVDQLTAVTIDCYEIGIQLAKQRINDNPDEIADRVVTQLANELDDVGDTMAPAQSVLSDTKSNEYERTVARLTKRIRSLQNTLEQKKKRINDLIEAKQSIETTNDQLRDRLRRVKLGYSRVDDRNVRLALPQDILFESGEYTLRQAVKPDLRDVVLLIESLPPDWTVAVEGHTDDVQLSASHELNDNWSLSARRALSVLRFLEDNGANARRLEAVANSKYDTVAPNRTAADRRRNRRVELTFVPERTTLTRRPVADSIPILDTRPYDVIPNDEDINRRVDFTYTGELVEGITRLVDPIGYTVESTLPDTYSSRMAVNASDVRVGRVLESIAIIKDDDVDLSVSLMDRTVYLKRPGGNKP